MARTINDSDDTVSDLWDTNTTDSDRQNPVLLPYATYILVLIKHSICCQVFKQHLTTIKCRISVRSGLKKNQIIFIEQRKQDVYFR